MHTVPDSESLQIPKRGSLRVTRGPRDVVAPAEKISGQQRAVLPGRATGLAVDTAHVYVPQPDGDAIRIVARRPGGPIRTLPVGRRPASVAVAAPDSVIGR